MALSLRMSLSFRSGPFRHFTYLRGIAVFSMSIRLSFPRRSKHGEPHAPL